MKCYCYETETDFVLLVENAEPKHIDTILHAWFVKTKRGYEKTYPKNGEDKLWHKNSADKELIKKNFARLGQSMFSGVFDWKSVLTALAQKFLENKIQWYIFGSCCEAVRGVKITPNDIDIIVHTSDFYKVKELFPDNIVEPFVDNHGTWLVRYFGRLCLGGAIVDIAADEKLNMENHPYENLTWNGFEVFAEPFHKRYKIETERGRENRLKAMREYMDLTK
ncbi:MAG: hypothetical protein WCR95_05645 [Eubacteriales bacterium]